MNDNDKQMNFVQYPPSYYSLPQCNLPPNMYTMNTIQPQCPKRGVKRKQEFEDRPSKRFLSEKLLQLRLSEEMNQNQYVNNNIFSQNQNSVTPEQNVNNFVMEMETPQPVNVETVKMQDVETSGILSSLKVDPRIINESKSEPIVPRTLLPAEYNQRAIVLYVSPSTIIEDAIHKSKKDSSDSMDEE